MSEQQEELENLKKVFEETLDEQLENKLVPIRHDLKLIKDMLAAMK